MRARLGSLNSAAIGLAALAVAAAACGAPAARAPGSGGRGSRAAPAPAPTRVVTFRPDHFTAAATVTGSCWTESVAAPRRGAYRCMTGNGILDPCFSGVGPGEVACPDPRANPDRQMGTVIRLTQALPPPSGGPPPGPSPEHPWRFDLAGGGECGAMTGTILPGHPYGCAVATTAGSRGQPGAAGARSLYCTPPRPTGPSRASYITDCAPLAGQPAASGAPRLAAGHRYPIAAMWL